VVQNFTEAAKWYRRAAAQGDASAQLNLGLLHGDGQGVAQDYKKSHMWLNLAAVKGNKTSVNARDDVAKRMTPQQIGEAQEMARQCMERNFKGCD
jgi:TPR repeat protein